MPAAHGFAAARAVAEFLLGRGLAAPEMGIVVGSGLGAFADSVGGARSVDARDISGYPAGRVEGHAGRLAAGTVEGRRVLVFQGRVHPYEGFGR